jgi:hypothetical protein
MERKVILMKCFQLELEVHDKEDPECKTAQARYLARGYNDVLWTDSLDVALNYLKNEAKGREQ